MSGDMNTALGNCIIMCTLILEYVTQLGIVCKLINNGDDCVVIMERKDEQRFVESLDQWFLNFGFEMKVEPTVDVFEEIEFCQMHPVLVDNWVMVRNPVAALTKDVMSLGCRTFHTYRQWLGAVGKCGYSLYGDTPIFSEFYRRMSEMGVSSNIKHSNLLSNSGFFRLSKMPRVRLTDNVTVKDVARLSFQRAFGITVREQYEVEAMFRGLLIENQLAYATAVTQQFFHIAHGIL